jgi:hypothetical protein
MAAQTTSGAGWPMAAESPTPTATEMKNAAIPTLHTRTGI